MIIGKAGYFEIGFDIIKEWSNKGNLVNGFFFIGIDSELFPGKVINEDIPMEIKYLKESLQNVKENEDLFNMPKEQAFRNIHKLRYPSLDSPDFEIYDYSIECMSIIDYQCCVYAVKNKNEIRILAAKDFYDRDKGFFILDNIKVYETLISLEELNQILVQLPTYEELRKQHDALYENDE